MVYFSTGSPIVLGILREKIIGNKDVEIVVGGTDESSSTPSSNREVSRKAAVPLTWKLASILLVAMKSTIKQQMKINNT
jgi:hypothetical protein